LELSERGEDAARNIRYAALLTLVVCFAATLAIPSVNKLGLRAVSLFYDQYVWAEPPGIALLAIFSIAAYVMARKPAGGTEPDAPSWVRDSPRNWLILILATLLITWAGTHLVFDAYPFVDDEYSGWFQAAVYAQGRSAAVVPAPWCTWIGALTPTSIRVVPPCTWRLSYLPIHAMIRGAFQALHADTLAEPVMGAVSVWLVLLVCRRKYPDLLNMPMLAGLFLACSAQFLVTTMSAYSMPAHLLASTVWLYVYIRPERWAVALVPWVGIAAMGVHSPYPHLLFVAPLVVAYLAQRRFLTFAYNGAVYLAGIMFWTGRFLAHKTVGDVTVATPGAVVGAARGILTPHGDGITGAMTFSLFATWAVPIALIAILVAFLGWRRLDLFGKSLAMSLAFTIVGRAVFFDVQGAGWGARFYHASIANGAILAALGVVQMIDALGSRRTYRLVGVALATAVLIELPMRGLQARSIVHPNAEASRYLESIDADIVVVYFEDILWGRQLLRNDPFLRNRPKLMGFSELKQPGLDSLNRLFPGEVRFVTTAELQRFIPKSGRIGPFVVH
jgi:hypothetical protein